jgi:hypothetical protein
MEQMSRLRQSRNTTYLDCDEGKSSEVIGTTISGEESDTMIH